MTLPVHPDIAPLAPLLGTWSGSGTGEYPSIEPFSYEETVTFSHVGKPFLVYNQRTRDGSDGRPLHAESGYVRVAGPDRIELVLAHPFGIVEVSEGALVDSRVNLRSVAVAATATAKEVTQIERDVVLDGDSLRYEVRMAAVRIPLTHHLRAELHRVE